MLGNNLNKYEIRHRALLEVIRICGGVTAYSRSMNVSRSRASNWVNRSEIEIPYEYLVMTEDLTNINIDRLSPFTNIANKIIRKFRSYVKQSPIMINTDNIIIGNHPYLKHFKEEREIFVGTDGILISGLNQLENHRSLNLKRAKVMVLDLEIFLLDESRTLSEFNIDFLISERVAIGLRLEQLLGNRQGQRNDLINSGNKNKSLRRSGDEVTKTRGKRIARIIGFTSRDIYYRAKKIYLSGDFELIDKVDQKQIHVTVASKLVKKQIVSLMQSQEQPI